MGRLKLFNREKTPAQLCSEKAVIMVKNRQWASLNAMLADALVAGHLQPIDLDFSPERQADEPKKGRLWNAFQEAAERYNSGGRIAVESRNSGARVARGKGEEEDNSHREGIWLLRSWEVASKVGWLGEVLQEMKPTQATLDAPAQRSSLVLRQIYSGVRAFMADVRMNPDPREMPMSMHHSVLPIDAAPGIVRLNFSVAGEIFWTPDPIEDVPEADCVSNQTPYNSNAVRCHVSPRVYVECLEGSDYNDSFNVGWCNGTVFFAREPAQLEAFIATRQSLKVLEEGLDRAAGLIENLPGLLDSGLEPDQQAEHRQCHMRLFNRACQAGNWVAVDALLERGANPGRFPHETRGPIFNLVYFSQGHSCGPHEASEEAYRSCLSRMVDAGLDVNEPDSFTGLTPLMLAAAGKEHWAMAALLEHGADPMQKDAQGLTVFQKAKADEQSHRNREGLPRADSIAYLDAWRANHEIERIMALSRSPAKAP
jgi:Ankyrin repeat